MSRERGVKSIWRSTTVRSRLCRSSRAALTNEAISGSPPSSQRLIAAIAVGGVAALITFLRFPPNGPLLLPGDYTLHWWAGDALRRGYSPYAVINAWSPLYPFCSGYLYWLPTALLLEPLAWLSMQWAMIVFTACSAGVFTFALTRDGWWRLPFLASLPFYHAIMGGQVTPLVIAAVLLPSLGWLAPMKYTMAAAGFAYNLSRRYALLAAGIVTLSVLIAPWWPLQWWHELGDVAGRYYHIPLLVPGGVLTLCALLRWRRPEARLLVGMTCIPQTMLYYDQLPLLLVAQSRKQALAMTLVSWLPVPVVAALHGGAMSAERQQLFAWNAPVIVALYYLPAMIVVLCRSNVGDLPTWLAPRRLSDARLHA